MNRLRGSSAGKPSCTTPWVNAKRSLVCDPGQPWVLPQRLNPAINLTYKISLGWGFFLNSWASKVSSLLLTLVRRASLQEADHIQRNHKTDENNGDFIYVFTRQKPEGPSGFSRMFPWSPAPYAASKACCSFETLLLAWMCLIRALCFFFFLPPQWIMCRSFEAAPCGNIAGLRSRLGVYGTTLPTDWAGLISSALCLSHDSAGDRSSETKCWIFIEKLAAECSSVSSQANELIN